MEPDLNREEFGRLMEKVGLGEDKMLIDKLFWVFDEDGSGNIGHKELGIGLEMLKDNTFEEKLDVFFDLCDEDNSGQIDKKEFYNLLRLNATTSYEDRDRLKFYVN
jgi:Ca2+-binding EF-hand superfamily protein